MIGYCQAVLSVTCACITCTWNSVKPREQIMGQLPLEGISADYMFCQVDGDFTGLFHIKLGHTCRPTIVKAYTCIFVCQLVKATHIEAVLDMSTEAFIACSRPSLIMSDHGSNFIGARAHWLPESAEDPRSHLRILHFSASAVAVHPWKRIPLWWTLWSHYLQHEDLPMLHTLASETELWRTFYCTFSQVEACMNSRPLVALPPDDDGVEALTPAYSLIASKLIPICPSLTLLSLFCVVFNSVN